MRTRALVLVVVGGGCATPAPVEQPSTRPLTVPAAATTPVSAAAIAPQSPQKPWGPFDQGTFEVVDNHGRPLSTEEFTIINKTTGWQLVADHREKSDRFHYDMLLDRELRVVTGSGAGTPDGYQAEITRDAAGLLVYRSQDKSGPHEVNPKRKIDWYFGFGATAPRFVVCLLDPAQPVQRAVFIRDTVEIDAALPFDEVPGRQLTVRAMRDHPDKVIEIVCEGDKLVGMVTSLTISVRKGDTALAAVLPSIQRKPGPFLDAPKVDPHPDPPPHD